MYVCMYVSYVCMYTHTHTHHTHKHTHTHTHTASVEVTVICLDTRVREMRLKTILGDNRNANVTAAYVSTNTALLVQKYKHC